MGDPDSWQQEQISLAYVSAVATQAGATIATWNVDKDGVDLTLKRGFAMIELQMKCAFDASPILDGTAYSYDLDVATFDKLRHPHRTAAGFLGLVVVPRNIETWLRHSDETLLMHCAGYYAQIQDQPAASGKATKAIRLPRIQRIDAFGLDAMFTFSHERLFGSIQEGNI
ncbi:DUF4365 domain-containing protein [Kitasatospora purpeofusca]|uniref:DUF4365 domain-containing protein n=1 Tax=Kitasatospora purpeofusca TaxID=67352 RepID=UPI003684FF60